MALIKICHIFNNKIKKFVGIMIGHQLKNEIVITVLNQAFIKSI